MGVSISVGNSKMGSIRSVSLPAGITCRDGCDCYLKCYGRKIERLRPTVRNAYANNLKILREDPDTYWREVEAAIMQSRFFRFHVSGDIPDEEYLWKMIEVSERNPHCQILCFTKKYEIVNEVLDYLAAEVKGLPQNLHILFSKWSGMEMDNRYNLPEAHVRYRDGSTTASENAVECGGNCTDCAMVGHGCWVLKPGEQVVFNEH